MVSFHFRSTEMGLDSLCIQVTVCCVFSDNNHISNLCPSIRVPK